MFNVESLQTLESLEKLDAAVRFTFDKLEGIKSELAMVNESWNEWTFMEFVNALELWTKNNPITPGSKHKERGSRTYQRTVITKDVCTAPTEVIKPSVVTKA